jgi:hypothetical protein
MTSLADRDKLISHLQDQIDGYKTFLRGGGVKLITDDEASELRNLKQYLEGIGRGGEKDLATINALLTQN